MIQMRKIFTKIISSSPKTKEKISFYQKNYLDRLTDKHVLEIGAGTGSTLQNYHLAQSVILLEPNEEKRSELENRMREVDIKNAATQAARAENLPFDDNSFEVVVSNLVLCSVQDLEKVLDEIKRVLEPGGIYIFIEHIAAEKGWRKFVQMIGRNFWLKITGGCDCHRPVASFIQQAGFTKVEGKKVYDIPSLITYPFYVGIAVK